MTSGMDERTAGALMPEAAAAELLAGFGVEYPAHRLAATQAAAVAAADELGYPVVLKVVADGIAHKSDVGGVIIGISDAAGVRSAAERIDAAVGAAAPAGLGLPFASSSLGPSPGARNRLASMPCCRVYRS